MNIIESQIKKKLFYVSSADYVANCPCNFLLGWPLIMEAWSQSVVLFRVFITTRVVGHLARRNRNLPINIMAPPTATIALCHCGDNLPYPILI